MSEKSCINASELRSLFPASQSSALYHQWSLSRRAHCNTAMHRFEPARRLHYHSEHFAIFCVMLAVFFGEAV